MDARRARVRNRPAWRGGSGVGLQRGVLSWCQRGRVGDRSDLTHREREKALEGRGVTTEMGTERVSGKGRVACQLEDTA